MPRRRCVGCGRIAPKPELMRIALTAHSSTGEGQVEDGNARAVRAVLDRSATLPGRGAYLCRGGALEEPSRECLALADRRGGLSRALRSKVTIPAELLESSGR